MTVLNNVNKPVSLRVNSQGQLLVEGVALNSPAGTYVEMLAYPSPTQGLTFLVLSGAGPYPEWWVYNANLSLWFPQKSWITTYEQTALSAAAPIASFNSAVTGTLLATSQLIPSIMRPGVEISTEFQIQRETGVVLAAEVVTVRLGSTNTNADPAIGSLTFAVTTGAATQHFNAAITTTILTASTIQTAGQGNKATAGSGVSYGSTTTTGGLYLNYYIANPSNTGTWKLLKASTRLRYGVI